jgi:hypothetical protein
MIFPRDAGVKSSTSSFVPCPVLFHLNKLVAPRAITDMDFGVIYRDTISGNNPIVRTDRRRSEMKHLIGICLSLLLLSTIATSAQNTQTTTDESSAVSATVTNYIEAYYRGDADRMEQTLHPHYLKHVIHANIPMREMTAPEMVAAVRRGQPNIPQSDRVEQVKVLDVSGNIASAKLITPGWVDYMTLTKESRGWKIISVLQKIEN